MHFIFHLSFYLFIYLFIPLRFRMYLRTNVNIYENIALHAYLFIPLLRIKEKIKK